MWSADTLGRRARELDTLGSSPTPGAGSGDPAGHSVRSGPLEFAVLGARVTLTPTNHLPRLAQGMEYLRVDVQIRNATTVSVMFSSRVGFRLLDADDRQYVQSDAGGMGGKIGGGASVRQSLFFEVPTSAAALRLECQASGGAAPASLEFSA